MKQATLATTIQAPIVKTVETEVIRRVDLIAGDFETTENGERLTLRKGAKVSASEFAVFIADRENTGNRFRMQARWAYHAAGQLPNGTDIQAQIMERLDSMLSKSALYQLKSEANTIIPLILSEGIKAPLTVVKDAMGALEINEKTGGFKALRQQSAAARELIPLLRNGEVTQAKVREIRAKHNPKKNGGSTPATQGGKGATVEDSTLQYAGALAALNRVNTYLDKQKVDGADRQALVNVFVDIGRKLGVGVTATVSTPAVSPASPSAKK